MNKSKLKRSTKETDIECSISFNSQDLPIRERGVSIVDTGIGFLDHMILSLSKHSNININIKCIGDTHIDNHHTVEDIGIVLGSCLRKLIFPIENIERFGNSRIVMDETLVSCDMDLSNRPYLFYKVDTDGKVGELEIELVEEFFKSLVFNFGITLHIEMIRGKNKHHIIESVFKSFAVSLKRALIKNNNGTPSTKGVI